MNYTGLEYWNGLFYHVAAGFVPPFNLMSRIVDRSFCLTSWWIFRAVRAVVSNAYMFNNCMAGRVDKDNIKFAG